MPTLALDTAYQAGGAALADGNRILGEVVLCASSTHSRRLLGVVDFLLQQTGLVKKDITGLAVTRGPGFFTGMRIGLATAQGLAIGLGVPVVGVSTLRLLAAGLPGETRDIWALADARRGLLYAACYRNGRQGLARVSDEMAITPEKLAPLLSPPAVLVGSGVELLPRGDLPAGLENAPDWTAVARPGLLALLGERQLEAGLGGPAESLDAAYLRPSDAEVRFGLPLDQYNLIE